MTDEQEDDDRAKNMACHRDWFDGTQYGHKIQLGGVRQAPSFLLRNCSFDSVLHALPFELGKNKWIVRLKEIHRD